MFRNNTKRGEVQKKNNESKWQMLSSLIIPGKKTESEHELFICNG
jgi:hypothetical protein